MKKSIGFIPSYVIIMTFIVIIFAFIAGIMSYYRAFKLNGLLSSAIEKCEGYNDCSKNEIKGLLSNFSYKAKNVTCPEQAGGILINPETIQNGFCIYYFDNDGSSGKYSYGVTTFISLDVPIINQFIRLPIFSKTERLYKF